MPRLAGCAGSSRRASRVKGGVPHVQPCLLGKEAVPPLAVGCVPPRLAACLTMAGCCCKERERGEAREREKRERERRREGGEREAAGCWLAVRAAAAVW